jgi:hypothetical protein
MAEALVLLLALVACAIGGMALLRVATASPSPPAGFWEVVPLCGHHGRVPSDTCPGCSLPCNTVEVEGRTFLRVTAPPTPGLHLVVRSDLGAAVPWTSLTVCGLPWDQRAAADAELSALIAAVASTARRQTYVCPAWAGSVADART